MLWIVSGYAPEDWAAALRARLDVRMPNGTTALLRDYDARITGDSPGLTKPMALELTLQQVAGLCAIDAKGFVLGVERDIVRDYPGLSRAGLTERLAAALAQARAMGIDEDANLVEFLRTEALVPGFYKQPGLRRWMEKPGRPADQRFHNFMQVVQARAPALSAKPLNQKQRDHFRRAERQRLGR